MPGFDEAVPVYASKVRVVFPMSFDVDPGNTGERLIKAWVSFQACNEFECLPPQHLPMHLHISGVAPMELRAPN